MLTDLRGLLKDKGISPGTLRYKCGLSKSQINKILHGKSIPRLDTMCLMAKAIGISVGELAMLLSKNEPWNM